MISSKIQLSKTSRNENTTSTVPIHLITSLLAADIKPGLLQQQKDSILSEEVDEGLHNKLRFGEEVKYLNWRVHL
jgi:hypothetical protein